MREKRYDAICDLGCDDGAWTAALSRAALARQVVGVEIVPERARLAHGRGIDSVICDLEKRFPFQDGSFDLVHSNQVLEHVGDIDHFLAETHRVLKPNGTAIVSTENASSWHNIFASVMGWQAFSMTNISSKAGGVGNPLALHRNTNSFPASWRHKTVLSFRGLIEVLAVHGLAVRTVHGAGYHPLPAVLGRFDARHSHFITAVATKTAPR